MRPGGAANSSFDSDEELDSSLASELSKIANPGRQQSQASKLDLLWKIGKVRHNVNAHAGRLPPCAWPHLHAMCLVGGV